MKSLVAFVVLGIGGLLCVPAAEADCRAVRQRVVVQHAAHQVVAVKQAVITPVAVAAFAAYPVAVPQYSVGYDPAGGEIQELKKTVKELTKTLQGLQAGTAAPPPAPADDLQAKALKIVTARCAQCHTEEAAKAKGGGFVMLKGGQFNPSLTKEEVFDIWESADSGAMPKGGPAIPDEEARVLRNWVSQLSAQTRAARKGQPNP